VDRAQEEFGCVFSLLPHIRQRPERTFFLCPSRRRELAGSITTAEELKKEQCWPLG
jgi:hypothetical protein